MSIFGTMGGEGPIKKGREEFVVPTEIASKGFAYLCFFFGLKNSKIQKITLRHLVLCNPGMLLERFFHPELEPTPPKTVGRTLEKVLLWDCAN